MPHQCTTCGYVFADGSKDMLSGCPECGGTTFQFHSDDTDIPEIPPDASPSPSSPSSPADQGGRVGKHVGRATSTVREWVASGSSPTNGSSDSDDSSSTSESESESESSDEQTEGEDEIKSNADAGSVSADDADGHDADVLGTDDDDTDADAATDTDGRTNGSSGPENAAQASARSEFVSRDKLPSHSSSSPSSPTSSETSPSSSPPPPSDGHVVREPTGDQPDLAKLREELNDQFESIKIIAPGQYELNLMELYDRDEYIIALQENGRYVIQMPESWRGSGDE